MWNLKYDTNEAICNRFMDIENRFVADKGEGVEGKQWEFEVSRCKLLYYVMDKQQCHKIWHRELYSVSCDKPNRKYFKNNLYTCITEPLCNTAEINTALLYFNQKKQGPGRGNGNPIQYSCLDNPMDRGAWGAAVHGVTKSQTGSHASTNGHLSAWSSLKNNRRVNPTRFHQTGNFFFFLTFVPMRWWIFTKFTVVIISFDVCNKPNHYAIYLIQSCIQSSNLNTNIRKKEQRSETCNGRNKKPSMCLNIKKFL